MRSSQVPKMATWLFNQLGPRNAALIGDLSEEYRAGRSAAWYWRQVLVAIIVGLRQEIGSHRFLVSKAGVTGLSAIYVLHAISGRHNGAWRLLVRLNRPLVRGPFGALGTFNWAISLEILIVFAATAWVAGRLNPRYSRSLLFAVLTTWTFSFWWSAAAYWQMLVADSIHQSEFRPYLGNFLMRYLMAATGIWLGGWWSAPSTSDESSLKGRNNN